VEKQVGWARMMLVAGQVWNNFIFIFFFLLFFLRGGGGVFVARGEAGPKN
jgi:hypothetical protein